MPLPVIIDTDPGIDDALAFILALRMPQLEVRAITTVAGNIGLETTTRNALRLLALLGRPDIPVHAGAATPLVRPHLHAADVHGDDGMGNVLLPAPIEPARAAPAVAAMARMLGEAPQGSLRILALGPLTNLALLAREHPESARRVERIVAMGGAVREPGNVTPAAEFNIWADPEAAEAVLTAGLPVTLVPLDVTRKVLAPPQWSDSLGAMPGLVPRTAGALVAAYLENIRAMRAAKGLPPDQQVPAGFPLHDPCVMLHALDPSLFGAETLPLTVVTTGSAQDGATRIDPAGRCRAEVLTSVDGAAALQAAYDVLAKA